MSTPRIKLTKTFVDSIPVQLDGKQTIYRDSDLIGFALRVTSIKVYVAERRVNGKTVRVKIDTHGVITPSQARERAQQLLALMAQGTNPNDEKKQLIQKSEREHLKRSQQPTLAIAYAVYEENRKLKPRTLTDYDMCMNDYFVDWIDIKLIEISRKMVQDRHSLLSNRSEARANLAMRFLRAIFNFAAEEFLDADDNPIIISNPVKTLSAKKSWNVIKKRKGHIRNEQITDWVQGLLEYRVRGEQSDNQYAYTSQDFILTLILTGFRREEAESLMWTEVDLKYGTITAIDTKNGEDHILPMGSALWQAMRDRSARNNGSEYVFSASRGETGHISNRTKARSAVSQATGIKFTFHDLRRTFGTIAENLNIGQYTIKRLLNHKINDSDVTGGYVQISSDNLRKAMSMIEDIVLSSSARQALVLRAEVLSTGVTSK